jgi:hypothetical protein
MTLNAITRTSRRLPFILTTMACVCAAADTVIAQWGQQTVMPAGGLGYDEPDLGSGVEISSAFVPTLKYRVLAPPPTDGIDRPAVISQDITSHYKFGYSAEVRTDFVFNNLRMALSTMFGDASLVRSAEFANTSTSDESTLLFIASVSGREERFSRQSEPDEGFLTDLKRWEGIEDLASIRSELTEKYGSHYISHIQHGFRLAIYCNATNLQAGSESSKKFRADVSLGFGFLGSAEVSIAKMIEEERKLESYGLEITADFRVGEVKRVDGGNTVEGISVATMRTLAQVHEFLQGLRSGSITATTAPTSTVLTPIVGAVPFEFTRVREALRLDPTVVWTAPLAREVLALAAAIEAAKARELGFVKYGALIGLMRDGVNHFGFADNGDIVTAGNVKKARETENGRLFELKIIRSIRQE